MNKKIIILIITLVIIIIPNKIKAYELETESGYEYSKTLPESGYSYHHTECNGTKVREENVTYNEEAKTFNINGITEQNNCKFYFNKNGEEIIRTYEVQVTVLNGTIEGETRKVVRSNENTTFTLNPTNGYSNPTVTCTNNQTGSITNNTLTVSNVTNDTVCTVEYSDTKNTIQIVPSDYNEKIWNEEIRSNTARVIFEDSVSEKSGTLYTYDISEKQDESVLAKVVTRVEDARFDIYIQSDGNVKGNSNSSYLFSRFDYLELEGLEYFDTSNIVDMSYMFYNSGLRAPFSVDLEKLDLNKVKKMSHMFEGAGTDSGIEINMNNLSLPNLKDMSHMFEAAGTNAGIEINMNNLSAPNLQNMSYTFANSGEQSFFVLNNENLEIPIVNDLSYLFYKTAMYGGYGTISDKISIPTNCNANYLATDASTLAANFEINSILSQYNNMFMNAATAPGSRINLIYNDSNESLIDNIISLYGPSGTTSQGNIYKLKEAKDIYRVSVVVKNGTTNGDTIKAVNYGDSITFSITPPNRTHTKSITCTNGQNADFIDDTSIEVTNVTSDTVCTISF